MPVHLEESYLADPSAQYMYMAHFYANPASALAFPAPEDVIDEAVTDIHELAAYIRSLQSFRTFVQERADIASSRSNLRTLLQDDGKLLESVNGCRITKEQYARKLPEAWKVLECLQDMLADSRVARDVLISEYYRGKLAARAVAACQALGYVTPFSVHEKKANGTMKPLSRRSLS
jgi:hypothetical protein